MSIWLTKLNTANNSEIMIMSDKNNITIEIRKDS